MGAATSTGERDSLQKELFQVCVTSLKSVKEDQKALQKVGCLMWTPFLYSQLVDGNLQCHAQQLIGCSVLPLKKSNS
jgi:hypothetical protein